jgi:hypothetical protein
VLPSETATCVECREIVIFSLDGAAFGTGELALKELAARLLPWKENARTKRDFLAPPLSLRPKWRERFGIFHPLADGFSRLFSMSYPPVAARIGR